MQEMNILFDLTEIDRVPEQTFQVGMQLYNDNKPLSRQWRGELKFHKFVINKQ